MSQPDTVGTVSPKWAAVFAITFTGTILLASEFLPVSLLTPIASDLHITEGHAGQSISVSGLFALFSGLCISPVIGRANRKRVVLILSMLMVVSGALVAAAPNSAVLMVGRALIGIAIGGYWALTTAIVMRLVPAEGVPKALALINGGNAVAATVAAPLGSLMSSIIGWRGAFAAVVPLAAVGFVWLWRSLPSLPPERQALGLKAVFALLKSPVFALGWVGSGLFVLGNFALFTYLRPFLDVVTGHDAVAISGMLFALGIAGAAGSFIVGYLLKTRLYSLLVAMPLLMAAVAVALSTFGGTPLPALLLLILWGMLATAVPVSWWTWLSRTMAHEAEAGGGLMVAVTQLSITLGAGIGGLLFDAAGYKATFSFAATALVASAVVALLTARVTLGKSAISANA